MSNSRFQSIAVVGCGAVGLFYGAKLAKAGHPVRFLMRSDFNHAREHGIRVVSEETPFHVERPAVFQNASEIGPVDLVLVTAKTTQNHSLLPVVAPLLHERSVLLTLQNGLGPEEFFAEHFPGPEIQRGVCFVCLNRTAPAEVTHLRHGSIGIGIFRAQNGNRANAVQEVFASSGIGCRIAGHLPELLWRKLVWNIPFNGLGVAHGGISTREILDSPEWKAEAEGLMREIIEAARTLGCAMPDDFVDLQIKQTEVMGAYLPSSVLDFRQGNPVELESIWEEPLRRAKAIGLSMPRLEQLVEAIRAKIAERGEG